MGRGGLAMLLLAVVALAAPRKFRHLIDPLRKDFPLQAYTWEEWETLDQATKLRARGADPREWEDPPPVPKTEEEKRKEKEAEEEEDEGKGPPGRKNYPKHKAPGFRYHDRLEKKKAAFEQLVQPAAASKLAGIVKQLPLLDKALERYERKMEDIRADYHQAHKQLAKAQQVYVDNYKEKHGKYPETVPTPVPLIVGFNKASRTLQRAVALEQSERQFQEWLLDRTAALIAELSEEERIKPVAALARGIEARDWRMRTRSAALLGRLDDPRSVEVFEEALEEESDPLVLAELIRIRVRRGGEGVFDLLKRRIDDPQWPVRAAVVRELARIPRKESIDLLVARMEKEKGRLLDDIAAALRKLTGEDFLPEPAPWRIWWKKGRESWTPPKEGAAAKEDPDEKADGAVYFYGIRSTSRRVIFCIDISGSMNFPLDGREGKEAPRIETAKRELNQALIALPEEALFNIVVYSADVRVWKKRMQEAKLRSKQAARRYVDKLQPAGATNIFDALLTSMEVASHARRRKDESPGADTIFFLTDGEPTHGRIVDTHQILEEITRRNEHLGLVIHTVGVSREQKAGFLLNLAKRNGGRYVAHR